MYELDQHKTYVYSTMTRNVPSFLCSSKRVIQLTVSRVNIITDNIIMSNIPLSFKMLSCNGRLIQVFANQIHSLEIPFWIPSWQTKMPNEIITWNGAFLEQNGNEIHKTLSSLVQDQRKVGSKYGKSKREEADK